MRMGKGKQRVLENGIILVENSAFREVAAVHQDGRVFVMEGGHRYRPYFTETLDDLISGGAVPASARRSIEMASPEDIRNLYGSAGDELRTSEAGADAARAKLDKILADAARARASDVKFIQAGSRIVVRIKVAGREFSSPMSWTLSEGSVAMAAIFDARDEGTGESTSVKGRFQSFSISPGNARLRLPPGVVKLRGQRGFHEVDSGLGDHVVLRLFFSDEAQASTSTLEALGFDEEVTAALELARSKLSGGVVIAGSTGDGKSTTLVRCLQKLYSDHNQQISIVTLEDPVEYRIRGDGIVQIPIRSSGSAEDRTMAFRRALMHFVRINPDVGAISEIRDADAASEVIQFVATGHQVWTTIHGASANGILFRLIEMGIEPAELCQPGLIELLMKQTLAPLLCPSCAIPFAECRNVRRELVGHQLEALEIAADDVRVRNPDGCGVCRPKADDAVAAAAWCGYRRRIAVAEVIAPDEGYFERVQRRDSFDAEAYWLMPAEGGGLGGTPLPAKLAALVNDGQLDPFDAIRLGCDFSKVRKTHIPGHTVTSIPFPKLAAAGA